jgi:chemotaxis protein CheX
MFEAFVRAVEETFDLMVEAKARPIDIKEEPPQDRPRPKDVSAVIGFTGGYQGTVILSFPANVAAEILERIHGEAIIDDEEMADAVSEFLNMISGDAKRTLRAAGRPVNMSLPTVVIGRDHKVFQNKTQPCMRIDFDSDFGEFYIQMTLEKMIRATRVLITDDSRLSRRIVRNALQDVHENMEFIECVDGAGAKRTIDELAGDIDLLVLDFKMPDYSGIDLFRAIRVTPANKLVPILVVSSDRSASKELEELQNQLPVSLQPYAVLHKPYSADDLRSNATTLIALGKESITKRAGSGRSRIL